MPLMGLLVNWTTEDRSSGLEDVPIETFKTEKQTEKTPEKWNKISKNCGTTSKGVTYV